MTLNLDRSSWKRVNLGDVADASKEKCDPTTGELERYVAGEHMDTDDLKIHRWGEVGDGYLGPAFHRRFRPGQVLYGSRRTYLRKVAVADFDGVCANTTFVIQTKDPRVLLPDFLPLVMTAERFHAFAIAESKGSVNPYVNWSDVARYAFDLPPLDEQKRIAELMWSVHREVRSNRTVRDRLDAVHVVRADELLGSVEASAGRTLLSDLVREKITDGVREKGQDVESGVPYVRVSDMTRPQLNVDGMLRMETALADANQSSRMRAGDIVMALRSQIGLCHIVPAALDGCNIAQGVGKIAPDFDKVSADYLFEVLMAPRTQRELDRVAKGTTIREVGLKALREFTIPFPAIPEEQGKLVEGFKAMRAAREQVDRRVQSAQTLSASLSAAIFGEMP